MTLKINDLNKLSGTEKNNLTFFLFCEIFESWMNVKNGQTLFK